MTRSNWFAIIFVSSALLISFMIFKYIPHDVVLHINNKWHVMLINEDQTNQISFDSQQFQLIKQDQANLWINGTGQLHWHGHTITVADSELVFNETVISTSNKALIVNLFFYADGRVLKGKAGLN